MRSRRRIMGQHFLRDGRVASALASALPDSPAQVIEIGPGKGALTRPLLERFGRVRAVELDAGLAVGLAARMGDPPNLEVVEGDAASIDLDALTGGEAWLVAGNLPYSVGTPILRRLLVRGDLFPVLVVMVQREVAARLTAGPGSSERGFLSVLVEAHAAAEYLFSVPPRVFSPPPRVVSGVVALRTRRPEDAAAGTGRGVALAAAAFTHRRKKVANALAALAAPAAVAAALADMGCDPGIRPQQLSWMQWLSLAEALPVVGESP